MSVEASEEESPILTEPVMTDYAVVITTAPLDISAFDQLWLTKNGILPEGTPLQSTYSPQMVFVQTERTQLLILPDRLQVTVLMQHVNEAAEIFGRILNGYVSAVPQAVFQAIGFNFGAALPNGDGKHLRALSKEQFCPPKLAGTPFLAEHDVVFGSIVRFKFLDFTMQAVVDPKKLILDGVVPDPAALPLPPGTSTMFVAVNFQRNIKTADDARESIGNWSAAQKLTLQLVASLS